MRKEVLKEVIMDNRREVAIYKVIPRDFHFEEFGNYVFVGIRRAGKSYLLYQRMQELISKGLSWDEMLYINFEDERLIGLDTADLNLILEAHAELSDRRPILFLDEIQNVTGWEKFVRRLADTNYRVYVTGSNAKMLSRDIATTLGGRYLVVNVYPYSFREFLQANGMKVSDESFIGTESRAEIKRYFNDYFRFGGFPEGARLKGKRDYLTSIYQKIYLGDIAARHSIENTFALRILFKKLAESIKQPVSYTRIANIVSSTGVKVSKNTIINYVEYAKDACLLNTISNMADKLVERETNPKYYYTDNGILSLLLLDANTSLLENLVAVNLLRRYGTDYAVFFYNKGVEVDFYLPDSGVAIQVCYNTDNVEGTFEREVRALVKLSSFLDCRKRLILTYDEEKTLNVGGLDIQVVPVWKWLLDKDSMSFPDFARHFFCSLTDSVDTYLKVVLK
jgi:predicted AAA+ superfamily ATPase